MISWVPTRSEISPEARSRTWAIMGSESATVDRSVAATSGASGSAASPGRTVSAPIVATLAVVCLKNPRRVSFAILFSFHGDTGRNELWPLHTALLRGSLKELPRTGVINHARTDIKGMLRPFRRKCAWRLPPGRESRLAILASTPTDHQVQYGSTNFYMPICT